MIDKNKNFKATLQQVTLFEALNDRDFADLASGVHMFERPAGQNVFEERDEAKDVFVLVTGRAKVVLPGARGDDITLNFIEPLQVVGELAALDGARRSARLVPIEPSVFIVIPERLFNAIRLRNGKFETALLRHVTSTLRESNEQLRAICRYRALGKVACCLDRLMRQRGEIGASSATIDPLPADTELADMAGCARETVNKMLKKLGQEKCVSARTGPKGCRIRVYPAIVDYTNRPWPQPRTAV